MNVASKGPLLVMHTHVSQTLVRLTVSSLVWNVRNSSLDANTWNNNNDIDAKTGLWKPTKPDWLNSHEYTASLGGRDALALTVADQRTLELGEGAHHLKLEDSKRAGPRQRR